MVWLGGRGTVRWYGKAEGEWGRICGCVVVRLCMGAAWW